MTIDVTRYTILNDRLFRVFNNYKIAVVSDLHNAKTGEDNSHLVSFIEKENPDMIAITGGLVDASKTDMEVNSR